MKFLVGSYTKKKSRGLYGVANETVSLVSELKGATYVCVGKGTIYSLCQNGIMIGDGTNSLVYVACDKQEHGSCHIAVNADENCIVTCNYHDDCFDVYGRNDNMAWHFLRRIHTPGGAHNHMALFHNDLVYIFQLGLNRIAVYDVSWQLVKQLDIVSGGPRHGVFIDDYLYVLCELSGEIVIFNPQDEMMARVATGKGWGAAIKKSADNHYLYVSMRRENELLVFERKIDGLLRLVQELNCHGLQPRDFNIVRDYLVCANVDSDALTYFRINRKSGQLSYEKRLTVFEPTCVSDEWLG